MAALSNNMLWLSVSIVSERFKFTRCIIQVNNYTLLNRFTTNHNCAPHLPYLSSIPLGSSLTMNSSYLMSTDHLVFIAILTLYYSSTQWTWRKNCRDPSHLPQRFLWSDWVRTSKAEELYIRSCFRQRYGGTLSKVCRHVLSYPLFCSPGMML